MLGLFLFFHPILLLTILEGCFLMHQRDTSAETMTQAILRYAVEPIRMDPPTLDGPKPEATLRAMTGKTITIGGMGDSKHYASSPMSSLLLVSLSITPDFFRTCCSNGSRNLV